MVDTFPWVTDQAGQSNGPRRSPQRPDTTKVNEELARTRRELAQMKERQSLFEQKFAHFMHQQHVSQIGSPQRSDSPTMDAAARPKTSRHVPHPSPQQFFDYVAPSPTSAAENSQLNQVERAEFGQPDNSGEVSVRDRDPPLCDKLPRTHMLPAKSCCRTPQLGTPLERMDLNLKTKTKWPRCALRDCKSNS
jgi:hypothetical protein